MDQLTVSQLKEKLTHAKLSTTGKKADLLARLQGSSATAGTKRSIDTSTAVPKAQKLATSKSVGPSTSGLTKQLVKGATPIPDQMVLPNLHPTVLTRLSVQAVPLSTRIVTERKRYTSMRTAMSCSMYSSTSLTTPRTVTSFTYPSF
jgi:hypothetical protein